MTSGESSNDDQRLLEQSKEEIFEEEEMEYVELQDSEEEQYNQELRYLDEPNQSSNYSEIDEDEVNYPESKFKTRTDNFQEKIPSKNINNRSKITRKEEPMDVEPLENSSIKKPQETLSKVEENLDIEDPW